MSTPEEQRPAMGPAGEIPALLDQIVQLHEKIAELRGGLERLAVYWADTATEAGLDAKESKRLGDHEGHDIEDCRACAFRACSAQLRAIINEGSK